EESRLGPLDDRAVVRGLTGAGDRGGAQMGRPQALISGIAKTNRDDLDKFRAADPDGRRLAEDLAPQGRGLFIDALVPLFHDSENTESRAAFHLRKVNYFKDLT